MYSIIGTRVGLASSDTCKEAVVLFARGSGQPVNGPEETALRVKLSYRMAPSEYKIDYLSLASSYLGTRSDYPAEDVAGESLRGRTNAISAELNWTAYLTQAKYPESVKSGIATLKEYFKNKITSGNLATCPDTRYILAGYSQGAEVIGNTLEYLSSTEFESKISFVAFFGDPKYKSKGLLTAANGEPTYPWYRGDIDENTTFNGGVNDPRNPYIPKVFEGRVGSWCKAMDPICNGNGLDIFSEQRIVHETYPATSMDQAADEIASALKRDFAKAGLPDRPTACGAPEQDIVLTVDASDSMRALYGPYHQDNPKKFADDLFQAACNVRVSIVGYGYSDDPTPKVLLNFTSSKSDVESTLKSLATTSGDYSYPGEVTPTNVREAMLLALDEPWRVNSQRALIVVTNNSGTDYPSLQNSYTAASEFNEDPMTQSVIRKSWKKGGVELYNAIVPYPYYMNVSYNYGGALPHDYFETFNNATGGTMLAVTCGSSCTWPDVRMVDLKDKPKSKVQNITAVAGRPVKIESLDISGNVISAAKTQNSLQQEWYINCEDATQLSRYGNTLDYTFSKAQKCTGALVTKAFGRYCYFCGGRFGRQIYKTHVAPFELTVLPPDYVPPLASDPLGPIRNITKTLENKVLTVAWDPPADVEDKDTLSYVIRSVDGSIVGTISATKLLIKDFPDKSTGTNITVSAINSTLSGDRVNIDDVPTTVIAAPTQAMEITQLPLTIPTEKVTQAPTKPTPIPASTASRFVFSLDNEAPNTISLPSHAQTFQAPLAQNPVTSTASITAPISGKPDQRVTDIPAWVMTGLLIMITVFGVRTATLVFAGKLR